MVRILLPVNAALLACSCAFVSAPLNPMALLFIAEIEVTNATSETLCVTPLGVRGREGRRYPLPMKTGAEVAYPSSRRGGFVIEPGEARTLFYDGDDINLSEFVIEDESGTIRMLVADPNPELDQYRYPDPNTFVIDDFDSLVAVPEGTLAAFRDAQEPSGWPPSVIVLLLPWATFVPLCYLWHRELKRSLRTGRGSGT